MGRRNYAHVVDVPFWDYMIRIVQAVLALALVILTAYAVAFNNFASVRLSVFAVCINILNQRYKTKADWYLIRPYGTLQF